jgi:hypothetical protein
MFGDRTSKDVTTMWPSVIVRVCPYNVQNWFLCWLVGWLVGCYSFCNTNIYTGFDADHSLPSSAEIVNE